jgi:hypothetical protein
MAFMSPMLVMDVFAFSDSSTAVAADAQTSWPISSSVGVLFILMALPSAVAPSSRKRLPSRGTPRA